LNRFWVLELPYDEIIDPTDTYLLPEELWPDISHLVTEDEAPLDNLGNNNVYLRRFIVLGRVQVMPSGF